MGNISSADFQHRLRILNTNVDGKQKVPYAIRMVKGVGRRLAFIACHRAGVSPARHAGTLSNAVDNKLREDLERLKKMRNHRGLRHMWGLRVRGQHTKTTGRRGRTVGVSKKK